MNSRHVSTKKLQKKARRKPRNAHPLAAQIIGPILCLLGLLAMPVDAGARSDRQNLSSVVTQFSGDRVSGYVDAKTVRSASRRTSRVLVQKRQQYVKPKTDAAGMPIGRLVTREDHERRSGISCPRGSNAGSTSIVGLVEPLKAKVQEIVRECGAVVVSTYCRGGVTPNHRNGEAADLQMPGEQSPACIYQKLAGWPGGYSTDYWTAPETRHVHISYSRQHEWGLRFAHYQRGFPRRLPEPQYSGADTPAYADSRDRGNSTTYAVLDDGSRRGKYRSMKQRRAHQALQRHASRVH